MYYTCSRIHRCLILVRTVERLRLRVPFWPVTQRPATPVRECRLAVCSLTSQLSSTPTTGTLPLLPSALPLELAQTLGRQDNKKYREPTSKYIHGKCNYMYMYGKCNYMYNACIFKCIRGNGILEFCTPLLMGRG